MRRFPLDLLQRSRLNSDRLINNLIRAVPSQAGFLRRVQASEPLLVRLSIHFRCQSAGQEALIKGSFGVPPKHGVAHLIIQQRDLRTCVAR
jgi:hypothetical protein